jgi:hypothetical protein
MSFLLGRVTGSRRLVEADGAVGGAQLDAHAAVERFEAAPLGGRQVLREREGAQRGEGAAHFLEALLEDERTRRDRGRWRYGAQRIVGCAQDLLAVRGTGGLIGSDQARGVAMAETVAVDRRQERVLVFGGKHSEVLRQHRADLSPAQRVPC